MAVLLSVVLKEAMSMREYVRRNDDHTCEEDSAYSMSSSVYDIRVAHAQTIGDGGNVMTRSLIRSADFVDVTTVPVSRIFDHFRCMCLNTRRSDCVNTSGNPHRLVPHENETTCVRNAYSQPQQTYVWVRAASFGNAAPVNDNVSTSDVSRVECLHNISTVTPIECCVSTKGVDIPLVTPTLEHASGPVVTQTQGGKIYMLETPAPPLFIQQLLRNNHFMEHIRTYNQMFAMTSFGAKVDDSINKGRRPYVFKVSGQIYHWIGSLCPEEGLIHVLDEHNGLVRLFRTARDICSAGEIPGLKITLYNKGGVRGYELLTSGLLGGVVFEDRLKSEMGFDVIIKFSGGLPQRISKVQQSYMDGSSEGRKVSMNAYYKYQLHLGVKYFGIIFRSGRMFQQYVVIVFCAIEQSRLDWVRTNQKDLRSDYLLGLYDDVSQGDREGIEAGSMIMLPRTLQADLAICSKITNARQIDNYIFVEIHDPVKDPTGYKVVTELMMHGPCGVANPGAACTENRTCSKNFPKKYNDTTFFDTNGHTHYRRKQTEIHVMKGESRLDNCNVVPYNRRLSLAFHAHINVEYCGWSMLIKYLFKYISKGPDRILAKVSKPIKDTSTLVHKQRVEVDEI
ncbi:DNA helicase [Tanacetum coccineum]